MRRMDENRPLFKMIPERKTYREYVEYLEHLIAVCKREGIDASDLDAMASRMSQTPDLEILVPQRSEWPE